MEALYLLIPLALVLVAFIVWAVMWAIQSGQFDDLEGPAHSILMDEDDAPPKSNKEAGNARKQE
jgi:cbb3-type cytochrome oxidase maturation protein